MKKPGWVPKPLDDCPIVLWQEDKNPYAVQTPGNKGQLLLKMELYYSADMTYMYRLYYTRLHSTNIVN